MLIAKTVTAKHNPIAMAKRSVPTADLHSSLTLTRARRLPLLHPERLAQEVDVLDEKTQAALSQIGREEKAATVDKVSPIVCHGASIARLKVMGFAEPVIGPATSGRTRWLNPSYGLLPLSGP
jgi:hypothetical protein